MIITAEAGCNHKGNIEIAKEMIRIALLYCNADVVKFQKRCNKELLTPEQYNAPHPYPENSYATTYGEHREALEFNIEQHKELKAECEKWGGIYSCSVWDLTSAKEIISLNPVMIKIPSASNCNFPLLEYVRDNYRGQIHISLGMTTKKEFYDIKAFLINRLKDVIFYNCVSDYPVKDDDVNLLNIKELKNEVPNIGFSGHHIGIAQDMAALTLGAEYFERHFTLNHEWKGTDHKASLEPDEFKQLVHNLKVVKKGLHVKLKEILDCEIKQREKLKRVIYG